MQKINRIVALDWLRGICAISVMLYHFFFMNPNDTDANKWKIYINPLNNLFLFVVGIAIFYNFNKIKINQFLNITMLFISFIIFLLYPLPYTQMDIVLGWNRVIFVIIVITWVFSFWKMKITEISKAGKLFEMFGMATYGVYILHPIIRKIIFHGCNILKLNFSSLIISILAVFATIVVAIVSYYFFETKISDCGKRLVKKYLTSIPRVPR
jgi:peptidoglycan/LPS O-acetylase OafA/YrhL